MRNRDVCMCLRGKGVDGVESSKAPRTAARATLPGSSGNQTRAGGARRRAESSKSTKGPSVARGRANAWGTHFWGAAAGGGRHTLMPLTEPKGATPPSNLKRSQASRPLQAAPSTAGGAAGQGLGRAFAPPSNQAARGRPFAAASPRFSRPAVRLSAFRARVPVHLPRPTSPRPAIIRSTSAAGLRARGRGAAQVFVLGEGRAGGSHFAEGRAGTARPTSRTRNGAVRARGLVELFNHCTALLSVAGPPHRALRKQTRRPPPTKQCPLPSGGGGPAGPHLFVSAGIMLNFSTSSAVASGVRKAAGEGLP